LLPIKRITNLVARSTDMCGFFGFAIAFELYWPYFAYCCGLLTVLGRTIWYMNDGRPVMETLNAAMVQLLRQALWRMLLKVVSIWLLGGSLLFAFGAWLCKVI
jgi:hypothetical protein